MKNQTSSPFAKVYFTLTELLIVMAVLAILISLVIPALKEGLGKARGMACAQKLKSVTQANLTFAEDNNGRLVDFLYPHQTLHNKGYLGTSAPFATHFGCPNRLEGVSNESPAWGYSNQISPFNWGNRTGAALSSIIRPEETFMFVEIYIKEDQPEGNGSYHLEPKWFPYYGHEMAGAQSYCDGHVTLLPLSLMRAYWYPKDNWDKRKPWSLGN